MAKITEIDYTKRCRLTLHRVSNNQALPEQMDIVVYGIMPDDLFEIPNDTASRLAAKYPDYTASIFEVGSMPDVA